MIDFNLTTILVALFACLPPTLLAWAALRSSKKNTEKADVLLEKTAEIHVATNGTLHTLTKSLEVATERIAGLERLITETETAKKEAKDVEAKRNQP